MVPVPLHAISPLRGAIVTRTRFGPNKPCIALFLLALSGSDYYLYELYVLYVPPKAPLRKVALVVFLVA